MIHYYTCMDSVSLYYNWGLEYAKYIGIEILAFILDWYIKIKSLFKSKKTDYIYALRSSQKWTFGIYFPFIQKEWQMYTMLTPENMSNFDWRRVEEKNGQIIYTDIDDTVILSKSDAITEGDSSKILSATLFLDEMIDITNDIRNLFDVEVCNFNVRLYDLFPYFMEKYNLSSQFKYEPRIEVIISSDCSLKVFYFHDQLSLVE